MKTLLSFAVVSLLAIAVMNAEEKRLWAKSVLGQKAPAFVVEKWLGDEPKREGKLVLIDFWATWCGPWPRNFFSVKAANIRLRVGSLVPC